MTDLSGPAPVPPSAGSRRGWIVAGVAVVVLLAGVAAFVLRPDHAAPVSGATTTPASSPSPTATGPVTGLRIGLLAPLTGAAADLGKPLRNGAQLAVDGYNTTHPAAPVTLAAFDSAGDSGSVAHGAAVEAVGNDKVVAMVGPLLGGETEAVAPVLDEGNLPFVTVSSRTSLTGNGWTMLHRGAGRDADEGTAAARYIQQTLKATTVYVVADDSTFATDVTGQLTQVLGAGVVGHSAVAEGQTSFTTVVTAVIASGATAVFFTFADVEAGYLLEQLRHRGWHGTLVGTSTMFTDGFFDVGRSIAEGTVLLSLSRPPVSPKNPFVVAYTRKYKTAPGYLADVAYDLTTAYLEGIAAGNTTRESLQAWLGSYHKAGAASGVTYAWAAGGELAPGSARVWAWKARGGRWIPVSAVSLV